VKVADGLSSLFEAVRDQTKSPLTDAEPPRDFDGCVLELAEELDVSIGGVQERGKVRSGNQEDVYRGLRVDVAKGEEIVVFVHDVGGDIALRDLAEKALAHRLASFAVG
jgi:hypothetical protein